VNQGSQVLDMGLPAPITRAAPRWTLLFPQSVAAMSSNEIRTALAGGVYTDVETLKALNAAGFQDLTGMSAENPTRWIASRNSPLIR